ncbi:MAG TPA: PQQ-binding-like beta-propeller repeat protein [Gaiellaceae bacterium]|nr:PQQ-binding-like beta-propeller repeat protein [Gaiellaceae bacterium]
MVTVLDGDRRRRVAGARVRVAGMVRVSGRDGVTRFRVATLRRLPVTIAASGFSARTVRVDFTKRRQATLRIYQPELQWPLYGVTPSRSQAQDHIRLRPPFRTVWSISLGGLIEFPAVVDDGVAYIGNAHASVRAISMRFGKLVWRHDTPGRPRMASSPAVVGSSLVYHTMDGRVVLLDRANGRVRWVWRAGAPIEPSPVVRGGVDYFGASNGRLYALDLRTRELRWSRDLGAKITSSAALAGGTLYVGDYAGRVWALAARDGAVRWTGAVDGRVYGTPAVAGGRVFVPSSTGMSLTAFSTRGGELWRVHTGGYVYSSPAVWRGRVFFGSYDGSLYAVSAASGSLLWRVGVGGPISGAAVVVDGVAYAGSFAHRIVGVDATSGRTLLTFGHGHYVPVSGNGMRLLFHGYSRLYAVEPRKHRAVTRITAAHTRDPRRQRS